MAISPPSWVRRFLLWWGLCLAALGGFGSPALAAEAAFVHPQTQVAFPAQAKGGFTFQFSKDYESETPHFGYSVRYRHANGTWIDVYVYNPSDTPISADLRAAPLQKEFQTVLRGIKDVWESHGNPVTELQAGEVTSVSRQQVLQGSARIDIKDRGGMHLTLLQMWPARGFIWKIRATLPIDAYKESKESIDMLCEEMVGLSQEAL